MQRRKVLLRNHCSTEANTEVKMAAQNNLSPKLERSIDLRAGFHRIHISESWKGVRIRPSPHFPRKKQRQSNQCTFA